MRRSLLVGILALAAGAWGGTQLWRHYWHAAAADAAVWKLGADQTLDHGRFEHVIVYSPGEIPRGFVLLLSGTDGWSAGMTSIAMDLAHRGALVAGIDLARFAARLQADGADCEYPDGDLENLSHFIQAYYRLPTYIAPILAGSRAGGTFAYATLAQAPANTFGGALSIDFCPTLALKKPMCRSGGLDFASTAGGVEFRPAAALAAPWRVVQSGAGTGCDAAAINRFVAAVPGAQLSAPAATASAGVEQAPAYADAIGELLRRNAPPAMAQVPQALRDLPIVDAPAQPGAAPTDVFAIMLSGDGGWAGLDKDVAAALTQAGITVIGLDSLRYFWTARTPESVAADLDRMIRYYMTELGKRHVLLIGYSQGADVLPFAVNRLTAATREHVSLAAVMGLSEHALFEFHMSSWMTDDTSGPLTLPEMTRIAGVPVLCIYGEGESDSLCPKLDPTKINIVKLKGGHHFDGDYGALAHAILAAAPR